MRAIGIVFKRELGAYLRSPLGWIIVAALLCVDGLLFQSLALGGGKKLSAEVLRQFFYYSSGTTMIAAVILSIRLIAEERQNGTIVLLNTSPVRDVEIVLGKFLSAFAFLVGMTLLTVYMPLLILVNGKISFGQVAVGYAGLILLGGAALAIGVFATSLVRHQLLAGVIGAAIVVTMLLFWPLSKEVNPPFKTVFSALALHARHFEPFMSGTLHLRDVVYYLAVAYFFLLLATKATEAKRWA